MYFCELASLYSGNMHENINNYIYSLYTICINNSIELINKLIFYKHNQVFS